MAKLKPRVLGRPALLDGGPILHTIWLGSLKLTAAGTAKPPIQVRVERMPGGWKGWPAARNRGPKARLWTREEWIEVSAPVTPAAEKPAEPEKKRDTVPVPPPTPEPERERPPDRVNGKSAVNGSHSPPVLPAVPGGA